MPWLLAYPTDARGSNIDELLIKGDIFHNVSTAISWLISTRT